MSQVEGFTSRKGHAMAMQAKSAVVASRVKEIVKAANLRCDGNLPEAVNAKVVDLMKAACGRAKANKRGTVRPQDL